MKVDLIVVDCLGVFACHIKGDWKIDESGGKKFLTVGPYDNVEIREDFDLGENMVATYKKTFSGYGQVRRWNYVTKEEWEFK